MACKTIMCERDLVVFAMQAKNTIAPAALANSDRARRDLISAIERSESKAHDSMNAPPIASNKQKCCGQAMINNC